jgi:hypothetical protein
MMESHDVDIERMFLKGKFDILYKPNNPLRAARHMFFPNASYVKNLSQKTRVS